MVCFVFIFIEPEKKCSFVAAEDGNFSTPQGDYNNLTLTLTPTLT